MKYTSAWNNNNEIVFYPFLLKDFFFPLCICTCHFIMPELSSNSSSAEAKSNKHVNFVNNMPCAPCPAQIRLVWYDSSYTDTVKMLSKEIGQLMFLHMQAGWGDVFC